MSRFVTKLDEVTITDTIPDKKEDQPAKTKDENK